MLDQILEGQQKMTVELNTKMDSIYADFSGKFKALSTHLKKLGTQITHTTESLKRQEGMPSLRTNANPKHFVNVIMVGMENNTEMWS